MPRSTAIRAAACTVLAAGLAAPLLRRRLRLKPPVVIADGCDGALRALRPRPALAQARRRRVRLQMYAYLATYQMPNDDPTRSSGGSASSIRSRSTASIGGGTTPTLRLQRAFGRPGRSARWEKLLVWSHWVWFVVPHGTVAYVLLRHRDQFPRAAARSTRRSTSA